YTLPSQEIKLPTAELFQYGFANYETDAGETLEGHGIAPDINIKLSRRALLTGLDPQLSAALKRLRHPDWQPRGSPELVADITPVRTTADAKKPGLPSGPKVSVTIAEPPPPAGPKPDSANPKSLPNGDPIVRKSTSDLPTVNEVIDHYIEALGGRAALEKITSRTSKGTIEISGQGLSGATEIFEQAPNKSSTFIIVDGVGTIQQTFDGKRAWRQHPLEGLFEYPALLTARVGIDSVFQRELRFKELHPDTKVIGRDKVGDREVYVLESPYNEKWFFDIKNGLLLKSDNTLLEDYREVDGVKVPFIARDDKSYGSTVVVRLTEIKHNVAIDPAKFTETPDCFTSPDRK